MIDKKRVDPEGRLVGDDVGLEEKETRIRIIYCMRKNLFSI